MIHQLLPGSGEENSGPEVLSTVRFRPRSRAARGNPQSAENLRAFLQSARFKRMFIIHELID
jgi:hypothetical protein